MQGIRSREDAETFRLSLLSMNDDRLVACFKDASKASNDAACSICLEEMSRRNVTCELTLDSNELRAAAKLARKRSAAFRLSSLTGQQASAPTALERLAAYLDKVASRAERRGSIARKR